MRDRIVKTWMIGLLLSVSAGALAQSTKTQSKTKTALPRAEIKRFFLEDSKENSGYETGPLHIIYSDGSEIVKTLPPLKASTDKETIFNAVGFSGIQLAEDGQTLGWTVDFEDCCTSYPIPLSVVVFRHHQVLHTFDHGQMVWNWMFVQGGVRIAVVFGPTHGPEVGDYRLYDVQTGKLISEVWGDPDTQALKPDAPEWAKRLQDNPHTN